MKVIDIKEWHKLSLLLKCKIKQTFYVLFFSGPSESLKSNEMKLSKLCDSNTSPDHKESRERMLYKIETHKLINEIENMKKKLREAILCPVCLKVPRSERIPICRNGHITCEGCYR